MFLISLPSITAELKVPLVSGEDGDRGGGLDILHSRLGNAEVSRVLLLGGDVPAVDLGHHSPHVAALVADVLEWMKVSLVP